MPVRRVNRSVKQSLTPNRLWKRISQITGVPVGEMKPTRYRGNISNPHYDSVFHAIDNKRFSWEGLYAHHEERHAVQGVAGQESQALKHAKLVFEGRLPNKQFTTKERTELRHADRYDELTNPILTIIWTAANASHTPYKFLPNIFRAIQFRQIIRRHGEDGALLAYAFPPRNGKDTVTPVFGKWEKQMIENGYLFPEGGMTRKGLRLFRERVNATEIRRRIEQWQRIRKINKI